MLQRHSPKGAISSEPVTAAADSAESRIVPPVSTQPIEMAGFTTRVVDRADATLTTILLHGFGAPGDDLVTLAHAVEAPTRFVFPEAPLRLGGMYGAARAWWPLDLAKLERALHSGSQAALRGEVPAGLAQARAQLSQLVDEVEKRFSVPRDRIVLGGFSQGSMLALDVALHTKQAVAAVVVLSGTLVAGAEWVPLMPTLAGTPIFQSHGRQDPLLPFEVAELLRDQLVQAGVPVDWRPFDGGHTVPAAVLTELGAFLRKIK